ncbi:MAG: redox-sensing transcriptional repressor Rex [Gemmatimonadota bacterium]|jgi:redox-sensing transcriptional repressor
MARLKRVVLDRLIRYYRFLVDLQETRPVETVTSARIGAALEVDPSQVRKDLGAVGLIGMSHVGYEACEACRCIRVALGFDRPYTGIVVGAGRLGGAILGSSEFERYGLHIAAAFDNDPFKIGRRVAGIVILPMERLWPFFEEEGAQLGILTVPGHAAQGLTDLLVRLGVQAVWNFTPRRVTVPEGILVRNERISAGLAEIAYHLRDSPRETTPIREPALELHSVGG